MANLDEGLGLLLMFPGTGLLVWVVIAFVERYPNLSSSAFITVVLTAFLYGLCTATPAETELMSHGFRVFAGG